MRLGVSPKLGGAQLLKSRRFRQVLDAESRGFIFQTENLLHKIQTTLDDAIVEQMVQGDKRYKVDDRRKLQRRKQMIFDLFKALDHLEFHKPICLIAVARSDSRLPPQLQAARTKAMKCLMKRLNAATLACQALYDFLGGPGSILCATEYILLGQDSNTITTAVHRSAHHMA